MDSIRLLIDNISTNLAIASQKVCIENSANNQSLNLFLETTYLKLFNTINGTQLVNANKLGKNFPGVDGVDEHNKIIAQISVTIDSTKIEKTIQSVIDQKLYKKYDKLIFIFLKKKKSYTRSFQEKIKNLCKGKLEFSFYNDIYDHTDFYRILHNEQDFEKTKKANEILDNCLGFLPKKKTIGLNSISISFHEEEMDHVYLLIDGILREGINVIISSKKTYALFEERKHRFLDYLILVNKSQPISFVKKTILVLSQTHITNIFGKDTGRKCNIYTSAHRNDNKFQLVSFDRSFETIQIPNALFRSYISLDGDNLTHKIKSIIQNFIAQLESVSFSIESVKEELIKIFSNFEFTEELVEKEFSLLNFRMADQNDWVMNFLILKDRYSLTAVKQKFQEEDFSKFTQYLTVLIPKKVGQKTNKRIENVRDVFPNYTVHYIDEYLYDKNFKEQKKDCLLKITDFVSPVIKEGENFTQLTDIVHWITDNASSSIAVLKAAGGVGKTTVCEKIHDKLVTEHQRYNVVFINAETYINKFKTRSFIDHSEYHLYTILKECNPNSNIKDENSFNLNYSLGNIIIIFDGIDEVISTIPLFNIATFLDKLNDLKDLIGKGKIIVNCRDTYIEDLVQYFERRNSTTLSNIVFYELLSFNRKLAKEYFSKHFAQTDKVKIALRLLEDFDMGQDNLEEVYSYPPFVLEVIVSIVSDNFQYQEMDPNFDSQLLLNSIYLDYVTYRVLSREINKKIENGFTISVDEQVLFLCHLAVKENGRIRKEQFPRILKKIGLKNRVQEICKGLYDHPFLYKINGHFEFRFAFLESHFKAVTIFNIFDYTGEIPFDEKLIELFSEDLNYDSYVFKAVSKKMRRARKPFAFYLESCKELLTKIHDSDYPIEEYKQRATSNLALLFLEFKNTKMRQKDVLIKLFSVGDAIHNFSLIDVPDKIKLTLDFSGLWFSETKIDNFKNFFLCTFSENTFFDNTCSISKVYNAELNYQKLTISSDYFDENIKGDNSAYKFLKFYEETNGSVKGYFERFFKLFEANNKINTKINRSTVYTMEVPHKVIILMLKCLKESNIITTENDFEIGIDARMKFKISKFIKQDLPFRELNRAQKAFERSLAEETDPS